MAAKWIIRGELLERKGGSAYGEDGSGKVEASRHNFFSHKVSSVLMGTMLRDMLKLGINIQAFG